MGQQRMDLNLGRLLPMPMLLITKRYDLLAY